MSAAVGDNSGEPPKPVDACTYLEGQVLFDPKIKYISVGFYPARNYQPMLEIGTLKSAPIILTDQHVKTLSDHLPGQFGALWRRDFYNLMDGEFAMHSASPFNTAILTVGKKKNRKSVFIKLKDLRCLAYIFPLVENQLVKYTEAMPDMMNFVLATLNSTSCVDPPLQR